MTSGEKSVSLLLPFPPSVNRMYRSFNGRSIKSKAYREWELAAGWAIKSQKPKAIKGHYELQILLTPPDKRRRDLGNLEKAISDALQSSGVIENDHLCRSMIIAWGDGAKGTATVKVMAHD